MKKYEMRSSSRLAATEPKLRTPDSIQNRAGTKTPNNLNSRPHTANSFAISNNVPRSQREPDASATPASRWLKKPKAYSEEDFRKFLARQDQHKALQAKYHVLPNSLIRGLRPTPLLPILNGHGYCIQGAVYIDADWRNKFQQGNISLLLPHSLHTICVY